MKREFLTPAYRILFFFLVLVLFGIIYYGAEQGRRNMSNRVTDWLPAGFKETQDFKWFLSHFHEGELLMVSWEGCLPEDPRLEEIAQELTASKPEREYPLFSKVMTTGSVLNQLTGFPLNLSREEAEDRMIGWSISNDYSQGCLVAFPSEAGYRDPHAAVAEMKQTVTEITRLPSSEIHTAGTIIDSVAIDDTSISSQQRLLPFFLGTCIAMLFILLRSWRAVFAIFTAAIFNEELSGALAYYCGANTDSISLLSASLLFVLTISGSLHLLNYYRDKMLRSGKQGAVNNALQQAILPCGLACLTTVLGLVSLAVSQVVPIRNFGLFAGNALIIGTNFFIFFIAAFLEQFPIRKWANAPQNTEHTSEPPKERASARFWDCLSAFVIRRHRILTFINITLLIITVSALPKLETSVSFHGMFPKNAPVIQDYDYLENRIGGLVPLEVAVNIPKAENPDPEPLMMLSLLRDIEDELRGIQGVESTISALTFVPDLPGILGKSAGDVIARNGFNKGVASRYSELRDACFFDNQETAADAVSHIPPANRWRITVRVSSNAGIAYGPFLEEIQNKSSRIIAENAERYGLKGVTALPTGCVPVAHKAQKQLLSDLTSSYISAFILITIAMICLLRGVLSGGIAMIPNIFPSALVFGTMALLQKSVDMGTMMTASVALGISVDGTIHFLTWYKKGLKNGLTQNEAIRFSYRECATAMYQATLICGGGMLVFAFSRFIPISQFAWIMAVLLLIALYGDLVLFPAILAGSLGRLFQPKKKRNLTEEKNLSQRESD